MAIKSKIVITFNNLVEYGNYVIFSYSKGGTTNNISETYLSQRTRSGEIALPYSLLDGGGLSYEGDKAADDFVDAFNADWNSSGIFTVSRLQEVVTIEVGGGWDFSDFQSVGANAVITNGGTSTFDLVSWELVSHDSDPCSKVILRITTTEDIGYYVRGFVDYVIDTPSTTIYIVLNRVLTEDALILYNDNNINDNVESINFSLDEGYIYAGKIIEQNINLNITKTNSGATVIANVDLPNQNTPKPDLILEYSLNGIDFQSNNVFTNQLAGQHTLYVRDQLGCNVSTEFVVDEYVDNVEPLFYISKNNSVSFSKKEVWDNQEVMKNDDNTLSGSSLSGINYREELLYQKNDFVTIQLKSNYTENKAFMLNCDDEATEINVVKKSNNIGRFMSMDCNIYNYKVGFTGVYFMNGNVYDENNQIINQYILSGNLPDFAIVGQNIELIIEGSPSGSFEIEDVIYDSSVEKRVIIIKRPHDGEMVEAISRSTYNLLEYEVYEFDVDFSLFMEDFYRLKTTGLREGFPNIEYYSETIYLKSTHEDTLSIAYWGEGNSDIFYAYGIKHFIRLRYEQIVALIDDSVQIVNGDNISVLVESDLYDGNTVSLDAVTRDRFLQASIAFSSPSLYVNNIGYIKKSSMEYDNIEGTNLYNLSVNLIKTGVGINENVENPSINGPLINIPRVLVGNTGLIKL